MKIKISIDQALDLPRDMAEKYNIGIVDAAVALSGEFVYDITGEELFAYSEGGGTISTTAINIAEYEEAFDEYLKECDWLIHFVQTEKISGNYQNATIASDGRNVSVIDSRVLSSGGALLALEAAAMAAGGASKEDIISTMAERITKLDVSFVLNTLKYMAKGGRCSTVASLGANILKLKPCIEVKSSGAMEVGKKYRGSLDVCISQYVDERLAMTPLPDTAKPVFVTCSARTPQAVIDIAKAKLGEFGFTTIYYCDASPTICVHCGPGTLGILFFRK